MALRKPESRSGPGFSIAGQPVANQTTMVALDGVPAEVDVLVTVVGPSGGTSERTVTTDDAGHAEFAYVPNLTGVATLVATQTTVTSLASLTVDISGSPAAVALTLTGIDPDSSPVGPPDSLQLLITGTGFDVNTRASFGVYSQAESDAGLGVAGEPKWEPGTRLIDETTVSIDITENLFPNPDPAIPVYVGQPDGTTAGPINFAFT